MKQRTVWPEITLDRSLKAPTLRQQIERQVASAIRSGRLPRACRMPPSRVLAKSLNVSRGTVVDAYEALLTAGMLVAAAGSGTRVAATSPGIPNFDYLKRAAIAAHYPTQIRRFEDIDGTALYLNVVR